MGCDVCGKDLSKYTSVELAEHQTTHASEAENTPASVRVQVVSDTHVYDLTRFNITPKAEILVLLGDISHVGNGKKYNEFLDR